VARNRKRRGASRPPDAQAATPGVATARPREGRIGSRVDDDGDPLGHAAPDVELAEAELAAGQARAQRPEPQSAVPGITGVTPQPVDVGEEPLADEDELEDGGGGPGAGGSGGRRRGGGGGGGGDSEDLHPAARPPRHRNRLVAFAQGSWRELQRVQWPDQRQVVQATGVVIGFVIVAGAYLGVADWVATKIVNFILS
jgi:preprotein translocase subunit SecE